MQVCNVTTPAQYFHLLRRQIKHVVRKPLVLMTPKSLLRLPEARSAKQEFISGKFQEIIDDESINKNQKIERVILSSGKVYYDLVKYRSANNIQNVPIVRVEQFYPYNSRKFKEIFSKYSDSKKIVWVQEEPKNMGAWNFMSLRLFEDLAEGQKLYYSGRPEGASPAVGSSKQSVQQQRTLIEEAFRL
jgi:2-oxoglutarate dehydrogenase E1 component